MNDILTEYTQRDREALKIENAALKLENGRLRAMLRRRDSLIASMKDATVPCFPDVQTPSEPADLVSFVRRRRAKKAVTPFVRRSPETTHTPQ